MVLLPDLPNNETLIEDLVVAQALFTPNGDGINDWLDISFVVLKMSTPDARVEIFDLAGRRVARLAPTATDDRLSFTWTGRAEDGALVPPGTYLCRIDLGAAQGEDSSLRAIAVAY